MGPRSLDRGNPANFGSPVILDIASMGPRSLDRGNVFAQYNPAEEW